MQAPDPASPWVGSHPTAGAGASPHAWGAADANLVLLDSLIAERGDGALIIGRGSAKSRGLATATPSRWPTCRSPAEHRMGLNITTTGRT